MRFRRWYTGQLYRIETLSLSRLIALLVGGLFTPTILLVVLFHPQKLQLLTKSSRGSTSLSPVAKKYDEAGVHPVLEHMQKNFNPYILVYNRVPKCASIYTTRILYELSSRESNHFKVMSPYSKGEKPWFSDEEAKERVAWMSEIKNNDYPLVYIRHEYFMNFGEWEGKFQPLYINIIRDPIDRFTSFYYFQRHGNQEGDGAEVKMPEMKKRLTLDDCVQMRDRECMQPPWQLIPYFCGQEPMCRHRASWALEKAKQNIVNFFAVVGIVEDMDVTFAVMEAILPRYFKGSRKLNSAPRKLGRADTKTIGIVPPSEETKRILKLRTSLALEYELYNFVRKRLYAVYDKLQT